MSASDHLNPRQHLCKDCNDSQATEASGRCYNCAEDMAYMLGEPMSAETIGKIAYG